MRIQQLFPYICSGVNGSCSLGQGNSKGSLVKDSDDLTSLIQLMSGVDGELNSTAILKTVESFSPEEQDLILRALDLDSINDLQRYIISHSQQKGLQINITKQPTYV